MDETLNVQPLQGVRVLKPSKKGTWTSQKNKKTTRKPRFWTTNGLPSMRDNSAAHFENPPFAERVARRTGAATHVSNVWNPHVAGCSMVPHQEKNSKKKLQRIPQKGCRIKGSDVCRDGILSNLGLRFPCWTSKLPWSAGATDWSWMSFTQVAIHLNAWAFGFRGKLQQSWQMKVMFTVLVWGAKGSPQNVSCHTGPLTGEGRDKSQDISIPKTQYISYLPTWTP